MTQTWWSVVRYGATLAAAVLTSVQQYYPDVHWISIAVLTLAILGFHVVPTSPPMYKMTVSPPQVPQVTGALPVTARGGSPGGSATVVRFTELTAEIRRLREENVRLQEQRDEAFARADAMNDRQVFIVPGESHLAECMAHLDDSRDVRDGDLIRVAGTGKEFVRQAGIWKDA